MQGIESAVSGERETRVTRIALEHSSSHGLTGLPSVVAALHAWRVVVYGALHVGEQLCLIIGGCCWLRYDLLSID